jgi:hypothetical protein
MPDELFPVVCPTCGRTADHDGLAACSRIVASLRANLAERDARLAHYLELERRRQ